MMDLSLSHAANGLVCGFGRLMVVTIDMLQYASPDCSWTLFTLTLLVS